ncbi:MAG: CHAT domain-containing protein [Cyanobacteriota bacterium]|nr:CHAT domain-containing protein [Cyanobacteriota bacterium]
MSVDVAPVNPCLSLAIAPLTTAGPEFFAIWVFNAPFPGAYLHHDRIWPPELTRAWRAWQEMFSLQPPHWPVPSAPEVAPEPISAVEGQSYSGRLMQNLGIALGQWLLSGPIQDSFAQSRGLALGQNKPLRLRLDIRDPNLIPLPWEIMQRDAGKPSISLNQQIPFSRTTSSVDPLSGGYVQDRLKILLVLGCQQNPAVEEEANLLQLQEEADAIALVLQRRQSDLSPSPHIETLLQPTPAELNDALEAEPYNVFFYAGHGIPAPNGGLLFLRSEETINGTELAQVLARTQVTLAVFNACWGAQPERFKGKTIRRSSLAEVLIHHGVPAVLAMRDSIADREAASFIEAFTEALMRRMPVDLAVAIARQQLLTLYKFNQPAWTLPILYMHPEFEGELLQPLEPIITTLPTVQPDNLNSFRPMALLRSLDEAERIWPIQGGSMRVGRRRGNDLEIEEPWVSQEHARIFCREMGLDARETHYFLEDDSSYGTLILGSRGWQKVHRQETRLESGMQIKFGSLQGQALEFIVKMPDRV